MAWELDKKRPLCPQICEQMCILIANHTVNSGDRLMSVRDVALAAGVTPNTVQKSFEQLEQKGIIYSVRGSGWYVSDNSDIAKETLTDLVRTKTASYLKDMHTLGLTETEILHVIKEYDK